MKSPLLASVLSLLAGPSLALSCMMPEAAITFNELASSEKNFVVVHGTLTFDEAELPEVNLNHQEQAPSHVDITAHLTGNYLTAEGFVSAFDQPVTLRALCFGPWCGRAVSGEQYLSFLERTEDGYVLPASPCGDYAFPDPSEETLNQLAICFENGICTP